MDRMRLMETFVRVVETGNFSAVAREARTTQSAISKQVQALEKLVGAPLLLRSSRSHALTEAGQLYYERCRQVLDTLEEALARTADGPANKGWEAAAAAVEMAAVFAGLTDRSTALAPWLHGPPGRTAVTAPARRRSRSCISGK